MKVENKESAGKNDVMYNPFGSYVSALVPAYASYCPLGSRKFSLVGGQVTCGFLVADQGIFFGCASQSPFHIKNC